MKTIEYKVSYEKMISRLPGLFAYLESDEFGNMSLHKATDSLDGCWGKIVENISLPKEVKLIVNGQEILSHGQYKLKVMNDEYEKIITISEYDILTEEEKLLYEFQELVYSFRTIIDYYYQYREELGEDDEFVKFIEKAIGKITVDFEGKTEMSPKFIYLANAKKLYNELVKMGKQCEFYEQNKEKFGTDEYLCCLCERYKNIGGNGLRDYVGSLIPQAETIANEYLGYAKGNMVLDFDIDLTSTYQDFGIISPYVPIWIPGKRYFVGDKVQYDGELYICLKENNGKWREDLLSIVFDDDNFERIDSMFVDIHTEEQEGKIVYTKNYIEKTINSVGEIWYDGEGVKHIAQNEDIGREVLNYDMELQFPLKIKGTTDSKLTDLRRFVTYYNDDNIAERPANGYDWLFYYRKGEVVNIKTVNNKLGNVVKLSDLGDTSINTDDLDSCEDKDDLAAYGDVIYDITAKPNEHTITFTYIMGVHLKSESEPIFVYDDDNNKLIKWDKFVQDNDENEKIGIKYQETYNYEEGSDLDKLANNNFRLKDENGNVIGTFEFDEYVQGKYNKQLPTYKFEFITYNNSFNYNKTIAHQDVNIVSTLTDFEANRNSFEEYTESDFYREDYFNGITYQPKKNIDVNIQRGSTSVFDKHIAFGEIKTLEDMEVFKNSSFFKMNVS